MLQNWHRFCEKKQLLTRRIENNGVAGKVDSCPSWELTTTNKTLHTQ